MANKTIEKYREQTVNYIHEYDKHFPDVYKDFIAAPSVYKSDGHDLSECLWKEADKEINYYRSQGKWKEANKLTNIYSDKIGDKVLEYKLQANKEALKSYKKIRQPIMFRELYSKASDNEYQLTRGLVYWDLLAELWAMVFAQYKRNFMKAHGDKVEVNYKALCQITSLNDGFPDLVPSQITVRSQLIKLEDNKTYMERYGNEVIKLLIDDFLFSDNNVSHYFYENVMKWKEIAEISNPYIARQKSLVSGDEFDKISEEVWAYLQSLRQILLELQPEITNKKIGRAVSSLTSKEAEQVFSVEDDVSESGFDSLL